MKEKKKGIEIKFENNELFMINHNEPVLQVRRELVVLGMIVGVN